MSLQNRSYPVCQIYLLLAPLSISIPHFYNTRAVEKQNFILNPIVYSETYGAQ